MRVIQRPTIGILDWKLIFLGGRSIWGEIFSDFEAIFGHFGAIFGHFGAILGTFDWKLNMGVTYNCSPGLKIKIIIFLGGECLDGFWCII